ncbi:MAG: hypothetical protein P1V97_38540 [Planctomycetota bacterium]|nr:hypothetical protein [Planctomycetota bacterium]
MRILLFVISITVLGCGPSNLYVRESALKVLKSGHPGGLIGLSDKLDQGSLKTLKSTGYFQISGANESTKTLLAIRFERVKMGNCGNPFILHGLSLGILPAYVPEVYLMELIVKDQSKLYRYQYRIQAARRHTWGEAFWTPKYTPEQVKIRLLVDTMLRKGVWARKAIKAFDLEKKAEHADLIYIE